jgi:hypothetical protein
VEWHQKGCGLSAFQLLPVPRTHKAR